MQPRNEESANAPIDDLAILLHEMTVEGTVDTDRIVEALRLVHKALEMLARPS